jgi:PKD repeat protein
VPVISVTPATTVAGGSVSFDGSASHSPSGGIAAYTWYFYENDGGYSTAAGAKVTHVVLHPGTFEAYLSVTDSAGFSAGTWIYLTVAARPPRAGLTASTTRQYPNLSIDFDGTASTGPDSPIASYRWDFGDGHSSSSSSPSHTYAAAGEYTVALTVTDASGATDQATQAVTVVDRPPVAVVVYLPRSPVVGQAVEFDGSGSYAPDGAVAGYAWRFGDGTATTGAAVDHVFAAAGTYTVTLAASDASGATATSARQVTVAAAPTPPAAAPISTPAASPAPPLPPVAAPPPSGSIGLATHQRLAGLRRSGLRFSVTCTTACRIAYAFVVLPRDARTADTVLVGGTAALGSAGTRRVTTRLAPAAIRALQTRRQPALLVDLTDSATGATRRLVAATTVR